MGEGPRDEMSLTWVSFAISILVAFSLPSAGLAWQLGVVEPLKISELSVMLGVWYETCRFNSIYYCDEHDCDKH